MAAPTRTAPTVDVARPARSGLSAVDQAAVVVALGYGALLAAAAVPGSFYGDDLPRMSEAARSGLTWDYLSGGVFGHLAPGYRFVFWLQVQVAPLHHGAAAAATVVGQLVLVSAAWLLFRRIFGPRWAALVPLVVLAFTPIMVPGLLWWSSAVNLVPAQLALVAAMHAHLSVLAGSRRARHTVQLAILFGLLFWEKTALVLVELPLLTAALGHGDLRSRTRQVLAMWRLWLAYAHPVWIYLLVFAVAGYGAPTEWVGPLELARHVWTTASDGMAAGLLGGPFLWGRVGTYFSVARPTPAFALFASLFVVLFAGLCLARSAARAVPALLLASLPVLATSVSTGLSRYPFFGLQVARDYRYLADLVLPAVLGLALAAMRPQRPSGGQPLPPAPRSLRRLRLAGGTATALALALFMAASSLSTLRYARVWHENPVGDYLANARATLTPKPGERQLGLYDAEVPDYVLNEVYRPDTFVSRVLAPLRTQPVYDRPGMLLGVLDDQGHATAADLQLMSDSAPGPNGDCGWWAPNGDVTVPLATPVKAGDWLVTLYYLANGDTPLTVRTRHGRSKADVFTSDQPLRLSKGLNTVMVHAPGSAIDAIDVSGLTRSVCVIKVEVNSVTPKASP